MTMPIDRYFLCPYCAGVQYVHEPDGECGGWSYTICSHCGKYVWYIVTVRGRYDPASRKMQTETEVTPPITPPRRPMR